MSLKTAAGVMTAVGLVLLLPWPIVRFNVGPTIDDYQLSESPFVRFPLESLRQGGRASVTFTIPSGGQWERIRASWGDPGIMVFAAPDSRSIYEFSTLGLDVQVRHNDTPVSVQSVGLLPYFRTVVPREQQYRERDTGITFNGAPGDDMTVTVMATRAEALPEGELVAKYEWGLSQKDHIIAPPLERSLQRLAQWAFGAGVTLLAGAVIVASLDRGTA